MESGKCKKNTTKQKQTLRYKKQTSGYQWRDGRGEGQARDRGPRGTNYCVEKWSVIHKNIELPHCTLETYIIL